VIGLFTGKELIISPRSEMVGWHGVFSAESTLGMQTTLNIDLLTYIPM
jgi:hypothetical protein